MPLPIWWSSSIKAMSKSSRSKTRANATHRESQISFDDGCEGYPTAPTRQEDQKSHHQPGIVHSLSSSSIRSLAAYATIDADDDKDGALHPHSFLSRSNQTKSEQNLRSRFNSGQPAKPSSLFPSHEREKKPHKLQSSLTGESLKPFGSKPAMAALDDILGYASSPPPRVEQSKKKKPKSISRRQMNEPIAIPSVPSVPEIHLMPNNSSSTLIPSYRARANSTTSWATTLDGSRTLSSFDLESRPSRVGSQSSRFALDDGYSVDEWGSSSTTLSAGQNFSQPPSPPPRLRSLSFPQPAVPSPSDFPALPSPPASTSSSSAYGKEHPMEPIRSHSYPTRTSSSSHLPTPSIASDSSRTDPRYPSPYLRHSPRSPVFQIHDHHPHPLVISPPPSPRTPEPLLAPTAAPTIGRRKSLKILTTLFTGGSKTEPVPEMAGRPAPTTDKRKSKERRNTADRTLPSPSEGGGRNRVISPKGSFFRKKRTMSVEQTQGEERRKEEDKDKKDKDKEFLLPGPEEGSKEPRPSHESDIEAVTAKMLPLFSLPPHTPVDFEPPSAALHPYQSSSRRPSSSEITISASPTSTRLDLPYSLPIDPELRSNTTNRPTFISPFEPLLPYLPLSPPSSCLSSPLSQEIPTHPLPSSEHDSTDSAPYSSTLELTPVLGSSTPTLVPETFSRTNLPLPLLPLSSSPRERIGGGRKGRLYKLRRSSSEVSGLMDPARSSLDSEGESLVLLYLSSSTLSD